MLLFCIFSIGGWESDDSVVEVGFESEDVVGCVCYPTVIHTVVCNGGVGWLISRADCEDGHVVDADCEEG